MVTGARRGIGRAVAERFLAAGWRAALNDIHRAELVATVSALGAGASAHPCDVSDAAAVSRMVDDVIDRHGRVDALVNNAGIIRFAPLLSQSTDDFAQLLAVNLVGAMSCTQAVARHWIDAGASGAVVMISSVSGTRSRRGHGAYGASKAGLDRLAAVAALELGEFGIRVNSVVPGGPIRTEFVEEALGEAVDGRASGRVPLGRLGDASEVAEVVFFLASYASSYVNGACVAVDGGAGQHGL